MARMQKTFQERAESLLIIGMVLGIALIAFTPIQFFEFIQLGLVVLVTCTFLQIAVGNIPRDIPWRQGLVRIAIILSIVAVVFGIGIALVPVLSQLGR
ncbi:hypothetical protein ABWH92_17235 [Ahrensia marina]|jgi:uncharacterized membrane protein YfcA|uniref:hypothetical protein n=1 Tax=Ahrensia marina TaxID=1514904 RepID=UPI0035D00615